MKRYLLLVVLLLAVEFSVLAQPAAVKKPKSGESATGITTPFEAPASKFGVGIFLGQPIGITLGIDLSQTALLDFKAAWDFTGADNSQFAMLFQGSYLFAIPGVLVLLRNDIVPYFGLGAELALSSAGVKIGGRLPLGLDYRFVKIPLELFLELGIGMYLFPKTDFSLGGGLGIRYRFW